MLGSGACGPRGRVDDDCNDRDRRPLVYWRFCVDLRGDYQFCAREKPSKKYRRSDDDCARAAERGADYERYIVYPVSADEKQKKAVADTVGAIALVTLGVGFFSVGAKDPVEVFVSEKGLVLNDRNFGYNDERFVRFPASTFRNVQFEDRGGKERVIISLSNYSDELIFDVPLKKKSAEEIRVSFLRPMRERLAVKSETAQDNSEQAVYSEFEEKEQADDAEAPIENSEE